ncbi:hypothetical protein E8E14_008334 [Neopestalotiopsis sp. 37M]|nr:hypothetical protein E8E14_008334 [Neopestalotiopsis sp. 37M]
MSLKPTWAVPEAGFDAAKYKHLLEMYKTEADGSRSSLEPQTKAALSLDARIQNKLQDFSSQLGREPTEDEKLWITRIETRCSGWLEGLRADVTGKDTVPVSFLNRLEDEQEKMILYFSGELLGLKAANAPARYSAQDLQKRVDQFQLWLEEKKSDLEQIDRLKLQLKEQDEHLKKLEQAHKTTASERDAAREMAEELTKQTEQQMCQLDEKDQLLKKSEKDIDTIFEDFKKFKDEFRLLLSKEVQHTLQTDHVELGVKYAKLEDKYNTALSEANDAKNSVQGLHEQNAALKQEAERKTKLSDELQKDVENLFQSSLGLREQVENLKLENAMLKGGVAPPDKSKGSIADLEAQIEILTKSLEEKDEDIEDLKAYLEGEKEATATAESHRDILGDELLCADYALEKLQEELEKLKAEKEEVGKLQAECTELRRSRDLLLEEKRTKARELAAASVEAKKGRSHNDEVVR